jgi:uncharacterized protein YbjT (DUF2867 family)
MQDQLILVIGSTGKTGSRIVRVAQRKGLFRSRRRAQRRHSLSTGTDPDTWAPALSGVAAAYVSYFPDLAFPGAADKITSAEHSSRRSAVCASWCCCRAGEKRMLVACEEIVRNSGLAFTLVRAAWFAQNFSEGYLLGPGA